MSTLFEPLKLRSITLRNRIVVSPMCQYSSTDGFANDWHLVHLGSRAVGGAGLVFTEAAAVEPRGRISQLDLGIWNDAHIEALERINRFIEAQGALAATQLAHSGRKGSVGPPWDRRGWVPPEEGGWFPVAPTSRRDMPHYPLPEALSVEEIRDIVDAFAMAARRSDEAGFAVTEIHAAHGYLLHEFLSPLSNQRTDFYGGSFTNRVRFLLDVTDAVRDVWPQGKPLFVRISATDWEDGGWTIEESVELAKLLAAHGVDVIDVTSGGVGRSPLDQPAEAPLYQVPLSGRIRREASVKTVAVGMITSAAEAESVLAQGAADLVAIGRRSLGDPYFPYRAAHGLSMALHWPPQYRRAMV
ncbi:MAG TPA: NADH:flavin oxidoreductase/NADH oxidase [Candidatus Acidoferrales bacterium]|nr:NADH:flavin oxidoreductase/NADH oxidase [Candidatus Acidoferrales bacterium]